MSKILKVSESNYVVQVQPGGTITFDVGTQVNKAQRGTVVITGNLDVVGTMSTIESTNTTIKDNILELNYGQTGDGITQASPINGQAGIRIGRGNFSDAKLVFDENVDHYDQNLNSNFTTIKI